ncbi:uncharacterized protein CC84DRAFT_1009346 [Paraphaeosphaeria sporulosa]|uniref:Uncharacterized protein n=1 Tax=Paraphaeosphaeria sporulosa TaxID=1460663 RepID=A0A177C627_9PLEO|nr:uncharacterized protein CC84DRAFT_1009346 [Paraphaeosphaeria sporulosa]OAG02332.1 hypothetical protein CC84DRAFT_1009346 [Paraphaeosphaeria sporulosa]
MKQQEIVVQGKVQSKLSHQHTLKFHTNTGYLYHPFSKHTWGPLHMLKLSLKLLLSTFSVLLSAWPCPLCDCERQHTCF